MLSIQKSHTNKTGLGYVDPSTSKTVVSILASFCVWTKSLNCKDAVNRDSTIQSDVRRFCLQVRRISSSLSAVQTPICPLFHPYGRRVLPSKLPRQISIIRSDDVIIPSGRYTVSRRVYPACIRPDVSAPCSDASRYSISFRFLSKFLEREDQSTVRTMWYPVRTRVSLRQESQFKYHCPDV
jgi:hypothetical protein